MWLVECILVCLCLCPVSVSCVCVLCLCLCCVSVSCVCVVCLCLCRVSFSFPPLLLLLLLLMRSDGVMCGELRVFLCVCVCVVCLCLCRVSVSVIEVVFRCAELIELFVCRGWPFDWWMFVLHHCATAKFCFCKSGCVLHNGNPNQERIQVVLQWLIRKDHRLG